MENYIEIIEKKFPKIEETFPMDEEIYLDKINTKIKINGYSIYIYSNSICFKDVYTIVKHLKDNGYYIVHIEFDITNRNNFGLIELDYRYLKNLVNISGKNNNNKYLTVDITYDKSCYTNYEDFISMIESIKWYRSLITDYELSPVEALTFAYDICKTIQYKQSQCNYDDNLVHLFVKTGNIVCEGYNRLLKEIVSGIDGIKIR